MNITVVYEVKHISYGRPVAKFDNKDKALCYREHTEFPSLFSVREKSYLVTTADEKWYELVPQENEVVLTTFSPKLQKEFEEWKRKREEEASNCTAQNTVTS